MIAAGVGSFLLAFRGGSDEGFLDVTVYDTNGGLMAQEDEACGWNVQITEDSSPIERITVWADEAIPYSGAGDGSDYGDNYTYDLVANLVSHSEWYSGPVHESGDDAEPVHIEEEDGTLRALAAAPEKVAPNERGHSVLAEVNDGRDCLCDWLQQNKLIDDPTKAQALVEDLIRTLSKNGFVIALEP